MMDALGNKITEGAILHWELEKDMHALVMRVAKVTDGGIAIAGGARGATTSPVIVLQITIPMESSDPGKEPRCAAFLRIMDPDSQRLAEGILQ